MSDDLSEHKILDLIKSKVDIHGKNVLGWNEDAVAVEMGNGNLVINIDGWVASTDRPPRMSVYQSAYRATINAISDIYAKGAKPSFMVASSSLPAEMKKEVPELVKGLADACAEYGVHYLGGDLNTSTDFVIDVVIMGYTAKLIKRSTASPREYVCWLGPEFGRTSAALGILVDGWNCGNNAAEFKKNTELALQIMAKPQLYPEFLEIETNAAIDCSDGLAVSLDYLAKASGVSIVVKDNIDLHADRWASKIARYNKKDILDLIFYGGEELGIVFTISPDYGLNNLPKNAWVIGEVIESTGEPQIRYKRKLLPIRGWEHFGS